MEDEQIRLFQSSLNKYLADFQASIEIRDKRAKFNLDLDENFGKQRKSRQKRQSCPGGVGNFGFNSFNFMTFVLLTLNAVANTNNNINNNNNNNLNLNYNTINQDSNNVVSNSENMNMVTAMILPVPGRRGLDLLHRSRRSTNSNSSTTLELQMWEESLHLVEYIVNKREFITNSGEYVASYRDYKVECEGWRVCMAIRSFSKRFLKDAINLTLLDMGLNPFLSLVDCHSLFPTCNI